MKILAIVVGIIATLVALYFAVGAYFRNYYNHGEYIQQETTISPFTKLDFRSAGRLVITQGDKPSLHIESKPRFLSQINANTESSTLHIGEKEGFIYDIYSWFMPQPTYYVTVKDLDSISISGMGSTKINHLKVPNLTLTERGMGSVEADLDISDTLNFEVSGTLKTTITGYAQHQTIKASGSSTYNAEELTSQTVAADMSGSSHVSVFAKTTLDASIKGTADLRYKGTPHVSAHTSGLSKVHAIDN